MTKKLTFMRTVSALLSALLLIPGPAWACRSGVADGEVTVDGRPIAWKVRMLGWQRNHLVYKNVGDTAYNPDGSVAGIVRYAYVAMIDPNPSQAVPPGNEVRQGLNTAGLSCSHNALGQNWGWPNSHFLANRNGISQVHDYIENTGITKGSIYFLNDAGDNAVLWELHESADRSDGKGRQRFRYATTAWTRDAQNITISGGTENGRVVTRSGFVVRANTGHYSGNGNTSYGNGADSPGITENVTSQIARNKAALQNVGQYGGLTVKTLFQGMIGHNGITDEYDFVREFNPSTTVGSTSVHGVLPGEDPRLSTMWTALGHTDFSIAVPVWAVVTILPDTMDNQDSGCFADIVGGNSSGGGLYNSGLGAAHVQARTLPMESNFFDMVLDELLPHWRIQDWSNMVVVKKITDEMTRVENQMSADAYSLLERMLNGDSNNYAPLGSGISDYTVDGQTVEFTGKETDSDGTIVSRLWNYGDGQPPDALGLHTYLEDGTYLVSFTVTDDDGVSYTDWEFVTVPSEAILEADPDEISSFIGGVIDFLLNAGIDHANRLYLLVGCISGTDPGTPLPGGFAVLPINWDWFSNLEMKMLNTYIFSNFAGVLDAQGMGTAQLNLPPVPGAAGITMYFAYCCNNPFDLVSNPVEIEIVP